MDQHDIERAIEERLSARKKKALNRNAIGALFGAFADPVGSLGKIFLGRDDAIGVERQRIAQDVMIDLLCKIDGAIAHAVEAAARQGTSIGGLIETTVHSADSVVGVQVSENMSNITLQPGTHIRTVVTSANNVTGLQIGGNPKGG